MRNLPRSIRGANHLRFIVKPDFDFIHISNSRARSDIAASELLEDLAGNRLMTLHPTGDAAALCHAVAECCGG